MQKNYKNILAGVLGLISVATLATVGVFNFAYNPDSPSPLAQNIEELDKLDKSLADSVSNCETDQYTEDGLTPVCAKLVLKLNTIPDSLQEFEFNSTLFNKKSVEISDIAGNTRNNPTIVDITRPIKAGESFAVSQTANPDYNTVVSCADPSGGTEIHGLEAELHFDNKKFEEINCTFTNSALEKKR